MNKLAAILMASMLFAMNATNVLAADVEDIIEARQAFMQVYKFNIGLVGAMAKGEVEYNAEIAQNAANNLLALSKMKNGPMWPQGSSKADPGLKEKTNALPETWTTWPKVSERHADLTSALEDFVKVAGKDLNSLRGGMKSVGDGCKGCHKDFRAEKKK